MQQETLGLNETDSEFRLSELFLNSFKIQSATITTRGAVYVNVMPLNFLPREVFAIFELKLQELLSQRSNTLVFELDQNFFQLFYDAISDSITITNITEAIDSVANSYFIQGLEQAQKAMSLEIATSLHDLAAFQSLLSVQIFLSEKKSHLLNKELSAILPESIDNTIKERIMEIFAENKSLIEANAALGEKMNEYLRYLLNLAKGVQAARFELFNIADIVKSSLLLTEHKASSNRIEIIQDIPITNLEFFGYRFELMRALVNILKNSIEHLSLQNHIERKYIKIKISKEEAYYIIEISDNGGGIPEVLLSKLFSEPIAMNTEKSESNGLGLYSAAKSISRLGGKIEIQNTTLGALFRIILSKNVKE